MGYLKLKNCVLVGGRHGVYVGSNTKHDIEIDGFTAMHLSGEIVHYANNEDPQYYKLLREIVLKLQDVRPEQKVETVKKSRLIEWTAANGGNVATTITNVINWANNPAVVQWLSQLGQ